MNGSFQIDDNRLDTSESEYDSDYTGGESENESDTPSIDHLSEGEEEVKELRILKENAKKDQNHSQNQNAIGEHEEFMDDLLKKLKPDEEVSDPFKAIVTDEKVPVHDEQTHWRLKKPIVSEKYTNAKQFKDCLTYYALANGKKIKYNRYLSSSKGEEKTCPWRCFGRKMKNEDSFQVISLVDEHSCGRNFRFGSLINYKWIGRQFGEKIRSNPNIRKAKDWALHKYEKTLAEHYGMLKSYGDELLNSNPGSTVKIGVTNNPDDKVYFDRFYMCLNGLKEGWKNGCRKVIALDGCFLKKPNQGELLTAIGRDGNNHIFPVAWAIVIVENKVNWSWYIELLAADLEVEGGVGLTLMSDQHKGLIEAVKYIMPHAEHRQCARHIYDNFRKKFSGVEFRNMFWAASKASYPVLFDTTMEKIKDANPNAFKQLNEKNPKSWSRAFFETGRGYEAVENGFSECFNSMILLYRHKPIITMLESIRVIVMERMNVMRRLAGAWVGDIAPNIMKTLERNKDHHRHWQAHFAAGFEFEVRHRNEAFKVDEDRRTCSYRMRQLSGIPCPHACSAIFALGKSPEDYIPEWFRKEMYMRAYTTYLRPVNGMSTWVPNTLNKPLPPQPRTMSGRPKRKRIRAVDESGSGSGARISKTGSVITCSLCLEVGHNKRGCTNTPKEKPVKVSKPVGRPRKDGRPSGSVISSDGGGAQSDAV
ncbi:uncharacterized protein [Rutidosis leptorrhynchoides]|uniref:uncharacterized protein n=1 Tax=Rutidosis leptorrhynchoides TaxID=125765 RepID=UPI003A995244